MGAAIDDHAPRLEALYAKRLLAFGGRKSKKPPTPVIRTNDDGEPLTEKSEIADHVLAFYGKVEQAIATDADGVAADYNKRTRHAGPGPKIQNIIPKHQLTSQLAAAKRGRRGGPDQLTDDMSRASPEGMARLLHPVLVKTHFESTEPIAAKGGYSAYFRKGQGAMELQKSYRGILLNNTIGKMHSTFLRPRVKGLLPELLEATQCGARPKVATDFITHTSLAFISDCQRRSRSCSITSLDLREAFHSVIREFCMQLPTTADELNELIERIDIPDFTRPALKERLQQPAYNNQHIDDEHLCHIIADHHTSNWVTAKSARHYQLPRTSTRSALRNMSLVDDLTDYSSTAKANDLINATALAAARLCTAAFQHGLKPHPEKTKAILMHYGAGAKKEKQRIAKEGITYLELDRLAIKEQLVTQQKARPLEKQILRRKKLSKKAKVKYAHSCSTSSLTYNHHVWNDLTRKDLRHISAKYMGPYRVAASLPKTNSPDLHISEAEAIAKTGVPDFIAHQSIARLRYLPKLLSNAPAVLLQLLDGQRQRKGTWSRQLKKDFDFRRTYLPKERWPSQTQHDRDIINWARQKPKRFTNAVKAASKAYILHTRDQAQGAKLQKDIWMTSADHTTEVTDLCDDTNNQKYVCYACGRVASRQGMLIHMGRDHPVHEDPRFWATGTACRCCQTEHHSLPRLIKHLPVAHRCRKSWHAWHTQTMEPLTEQQIADTLAAIAEATNANKKQGRHPTFSDKPAYPCDVTPLPLLETSPVLPKAFARLEPSPSRPPASSPAEPAKRQETVFITDRPRQAADLQQIMASNGITSISGLDYTQIVIPSGGHTSELPTVLRRAQRRIPHGEVAAIDVEFPRRTWYLHDATDILGSRASKRRTPAPWGTPQVSETIADEIFAANNVTREVLRMIFMATATKVPFVAAISAESITRQTPEYRYIANLATVYETPTNHYDPGTIQILDNGARDDLRNTMHTANEEEIDLTIADLLDGNIVARWGLRTATVAPASPNLNTN
ncbi:unnamed protein product, partial [Prorocentrum cordatum]